jgi:tRNA(fMet)-specific endonuclease VapC
MVDVDATPVLDTDVLIDYLRGSGPGVELVARLGRRGYSITAITTFELALGTAHRRDPAPVLTLLDAPTIALTPRAGLRSGETLSRLRQDGEGIDIRDALQAGICMDAQRPLITRNLRHFTRVPGLTVFAPGDWPS